MMKNWMLKLSWMSLVMLLISPAPALALRVDVSGPVAVCPNPSTVEYSVSLWTDTGFPASRCRLSANVVYPDGSSTPLTDIFDGNYYDHKFKFSATLKSGYLGQASLQFIAGGCSLPATGNGAKILTITSRYKGPAPIAGPTHVGPGETVQYLSSPVLANTNADCFFHHKYVWSVPSGWTIQSQGIAGGNAYSYLNLTVPAGTPGGTYALQLRSWRDDLNIYSAPHTFYVTVRTPVCWDGYCDAGEDSTCPDDCAGSVCNNGICEVGELSWCPMDCCPPGEICEIE